MFFWPNVIESPRPFRGLSRFVSLRVSPVDESLPAALRTPSRDVPWGWRALRVPDRHAMLIMPLWLYWPIYFWRYRHWYTLGPLSTMGIYCVREDGGYWVDGWFTWKTWESFDHMRGPALRVPEARVPYVPGGPCINRWERIARWLERMVNDWNDRDPNGDMRRAGVL